VKKLVLLLIVAIFTVSCAAMLDRMVGISSESKRAEYTKSHSERPKNVLDCVTKGSLCVGMTKEEVMLVRGGGAFTHIKYSHTVVGNVRCDTWTYVDDNTGEIEFILYFESGIVIGWSTI